MNIIEGRKYRVVDPGEARMSSGHFFEIGSTVTVVDADDPRNIEAVGVSKNSGMDLWQLLADYELAPILTTTQYSALGDLRRFGYLVVPKSGERVERGTVTGFSRRTLAALVDAGFAVWDAAEAYVTPAYDLGELS